MGECMYLRAFHGWLFDRNFVYDHIRQDWGKIKPFGLDDVEYDGQETWTRMDKSIQ